MIQINLLPEEYRRADATPLPMFLTIIVGVITVGFLLAWWLILSHSLRNVQIKNDELISLRDKWKKEAEEVDRISKEIQAFEKRQETIINISKSKIMWSQKLKQVSEVFNQYKDFWVDSVTMTSSNPAAAGSLSLGAFCQGASYAKVAEFRETLRGNRTFWYHFSEIKNERIKLLPAEKKTARSGGAPERLSFTLSLVLRKEQTKKRPGRK